MPKLTIIGAGHGRTGTLSLKRALERLGFGPCYHMQEVFLNPKHLPTWSAAARGEEVDWELVFADYQATVDYPGSVFWQQLLAHYPDARIILTTRDPERWYQSVLETIYPGSSAMAERPWRWLPLLGTASQMIENAVWQGLFKGRFEDRDHALATFTRWTDEVTHLAPPDRLLVFEVAEGWPPLCAFLGVPIPDESFPYINDRATMKRRLRLLSLLRFALPALLLALLALAVVLITR